MILQPHPMCSINTTIVVKFTKERKICASKSIWDLEDFTFSMAPMSSNNTTISANFTKERKFTWALKSKVWDLGISHCPWFLINSSILCSPPHVHFSSFATLSRVFIINLVVLFWAWIHGDKQEICVLFTEVILNGSAEIWGGSSRPIRVYPIWTHIHISC